MWYFLNFVLRIIGYLLGDGANPLATVRYPLSIQLQGSHNWWCALEKLLLVWPRTVNTTTTITTTTSTYLLTYPMEQSPAWKANRFAASQEIPPFYGTRRFITAFTSARHLSQLNAVHFPTSHFPKIHLTTTTTTTTNNNNNNNAKNELILKCLNVLIYIIIN
jgi:hypothetical protein